MAFTKCMAQSTVYNKVLPYKVLSEIMANYRSYRNFGPAKISLTVGYIVSQAVHHNSKLFLVDASISVNVKQVEQIAYFCRLFLRKILNVILE